MAHMPATIDVKLSGDLDLSGLPIVLQLAHAARDLVDHAEAVESEGQWWVNSRDLHELRKALEPIMPGAQTDG